MKIGLSLGGGAARGLAHIGVIEVLNQNGIIPDIVVGTSMGSVVGAFYCLYKESKGLLNIGVSKIVDFNIEKKLKFEEFKKGEIGFFERIYLGIKSIMSISLVSEKDVKEVFEGLYGDKTFNDVRVPFAAVAVDLYTGKEVIIRSGYIRDAVRASSAIPGMFPPVEMGPFLLVDGGIFGTVPVFATKILGADFIIAVKVMGGDELNIDKSEHDFDNAYKVLMRSNSLGIRRLTEISLKFADVIIDVDLKGLSWTDFGAINEFYKRGKEETLKMIDVIKRKIEEKKKKPPVPIETFKIL
ncbi:hypothetical protein DRN73_05450 [Candidatus Pacearchaeota archaeon]|nr:MAG: hypothetical protein DRN73_05450 [Candidatus Pacearchaeota archaeon]